jgi:hypothetical protein
MVKIVNKNDKKDKVPHFFIITYKLFIVKLKNGEIKKTPTKTFE